MQLPNTLSNLFILLFMAAAVHSIFLCLILLAKSAREIALRWLAVSMFAIGCWLINYLLYLSGHMLSYPHLLGVFIPCIYLVGPTYYFFVRTALQSDFSIKWQQVWHLLPLLYIIGKWWPIYQWPVTDKLAVVERVYVAGRPSFQQMLLADLPGAILLVYLLAAWHVIRQYEQKASPAYQPRLIWIKRLSWIMLLLTIAKYALPLLFWLFHWEASSLELSLVLILALAIHLIGYTSLGSLQVIPQWQQANKSVKYSTSPLDKRRMEDYQAQLITYMEQERPWLSPDFNAAQMSEQLGIRPHHLSQVLSEGLQTNFYDLVNLYRIREVQLRLKAGASKQYSIQGIALDCGFGSKSSFNRAFKKETGMSPTAWLNSVSLN